MMHGFTNIKFTNVIGIAVSEDSRYLWSYMAGLFTLCFDLHQEGQAIKWRSINLFLLKVMKIIDRNIMQN